MQPKTPNGSPSFLFQMSQEAEAALLKVIAAAQAIFQARTRSRCFG